MKKTPTIIFTILLITMMSFSVSGQMFSQEMFSQDDLDLLEEEEFPELVSSTGTHFAITDPDSLNVVVDTSSPLTLELDVGADSFELSIEANPGTKAFSVSGLTPSKTYYLYKDTYQDRTGLTTDSSGAFTFTLDTTQGVYVWVQTHPSTKFITTPTGGDCSSIGTWKSGSSTCTLTTDLTETIEIRSPDVTLNCDGHSITGSGGGSGVFIPRGIGADGVTVENCVISGFRRGIFSRSNDNLIRSNTLTTTEGNGRAVEVRGFDNVLRSNTLIATGNNSRGAQIRDFRNLVELNDVTAPANRARGIQLFEGGNHVVQNNKVTDVNRYGVLIFDSNDNLIKSNTFTNTLTSGRLHAVRILEVSARNVIRVNSMTGWNRGVDISEFEGRGFPSHNEVRGNTISETGQGIKLNRAHDNIIDGNTISDGAVGVQLNGNGNIISNNVLDGMGFAGISLGGSPGGTNENLVSGNTVRNIGSDLFRVEFWGTGISLSGGFSTGPTTFVNDNIIENNLVEGAESAGIAIFQSGQPEHSTQLEEIKRNIIRNNVVRSSGTGIRINAGNAENVLNRQSEGTIVTGNTLEDNIQLTFPDYGANSGPSYPLPQSRNPTTGSGIQIINVGGVEVSKNTITGNAAPGIHLDNAPDTLVFQNDVLDNNGFQVERIGPAYSPLALSTDGTNIYVSDSDNLIRKFSPTGALLDTFGGSGTALGKFAMILGLDVEGGFVYASDTGNLRLQKLKLDGTPVLVFDAPPFIGKNLGFEGLDVRGTKVIVTDTNGLRILEYNTLGQFQGNLGIGFCGAFSRVDCTPGTRTVNMPYDVAIDNQGNFYISEFALHNNLGSVLTPIDFGANRVQKFDATGNVLFQLGTAGTNFHFGANQGSPVGTGDGEFDSPLGIAVDSNDNLYVVDSNNNRVQKFDSSGNFLLKWGTAGSGNSQFDVPVGIAIDNSDNVYVTDHEGNRIQKFSSSGTFLTSWDAIPLPSTETLSVNEVGNYWGRNCGVGNFQGPALMQPGIDSNQLDLEDLFAFNHPVAKVQSQNGLNAQECPTANGPPGVTSAVAGYQGTSSGRSSSISWVLILGLLGIVSIIALSMWTEKRK